MTVFLIVCCIIALWWKLAAVGIFLAILLGLGTCAAFVIVLCFIAGFVKCVREGFLL